MIIQGALIVTGCTSQHDRDLADCRDRYAVSPYAPADIVAYQAEMVRACMRGRGY